MTLLELRLKNGMTQDELVKASGVKAATLSLLERGATDPSRMHFDTACKLAHGFGMSVDTLARKLNVK